MSTTIEELRERVSRLSRREREAIKHIIDGASNEEIAKRMGLSVKTVETHRARINRKLDVNNPVGVIRLCLLADLIETDPGRRRLIFQEHLLAAARKPSGQ